MINIWPIKKRKIINIWPIKKRKTINIWPIKKGKNDQYCDFCTHSNPQRRKSTFLRKDSFDGQYMKTPSFDIKARRVLKFHTVGGSHLWTVWQLPREDNFQDKKFWLQIARQNISWNLVKNGNGALLREGGSTSPTNDKKVRL